MQFDGTVRASLLEEYRYIITVALETELSVMLRRNESVWKVTLQHFETEIKSHIDRGTQRVLKKLSEGAYTDISEPTLRKIWEAEVSPQAGLFGRHHILTYPSSDGPSLSKDHVLFNVFRTI